MAVRIVDSADVAEGATIGDGSSIWHLAQVREDAVLGRNCIVGRGAYVGTGVRLGDNCKLQNYALVYEPAVLEDGVFVGPAAVFTNDQYPRAVAPDGSLKRGEHWEAVGVTCREGASIGALKKGKCVNVSVTAKKPSRVLVTIFSGTKSIRIFGQARVSFSSR